MLGDVLMSQAMPYIQELLRNIFDETSLQPIHNSSNDIDTETLAFTNKTNNKLATAQIKLKQ